MSWQLAATLEGVTNEQVYSVHGDAELVARAGHLFESVQSEFLCAARDLTTWDRPALGAVLRRHLRASAGNGFAVRKLFSPLALMDEAAREHLRKKRCPNTQVRVSGSQLPHETMIIDRRAMILAGRRTPTGRVYTVTTSKDLVEGVRALFDAVWDTALALETCLLGAVSRLDDESGAILRSLAAGLTDEAGAKRLGISVRTYRRRVAQLMTALDASSRFQAGLRAAELGLPR